MSATPLRTLNNKENQNSASLDPKLRVSSINNNNNNNPVSKPPEQTRLERLYSEQLQRTQEAQDEQERLEHELLRKDEQLLEIRTALKRANESNRSLVEKYQADVEFMEQEMGHYKRSEADYLNQMNSLRIECEKLKAVLREKDDEMTRLNQELDEVLMELEDRNSNKSHVEPWSTNEDTGHSRDLSESVMSSVSTRRSLNESDSEEEFDADDILIDDDLSELQEDEIEQDTAALSIPLTDELNLKLEQRDKQLKKCQFEIASLKHEKAQLYNYVNKLLKNKETPNQNDVLKEKLVQRKILRAVSINTATNDPVLTNNTKDKRYRSKRVMSNFVNLKSYKIERKKGRKEYGLDTAHNSDHEDGNEEDLEMERFMLGYISVGSMKPLPKAVTPLHSILQSVVQSTEDIDLSVD